MKLTLAVLALLLATITCLSLTTHHEKLTNKFTLKFDYAAAEGFPL